ncbi:leucine-rich repeat flightless-interacting protein 1-like isoform X3 [Solea solea]|uniref:leucine-rich repeat flightless-interacting protein 1-like isoform X3 n=1 Tax=Solea solea TaxID=90069 RepID=UPI0027297887|nr:leucine-rich repeat flightless-interacting protein 1-like isoform X3 [Solea solea]
MSAQGPGPGRKRIPNRDKLSAEDEALNQIIREAEARLAAKRAARAEAREIRMKELERREKERYYGLDNKWGHIEKWMEDSERYSRPSRRLTSVSDDEEKMSVGSRGSFRVEDRSDRDFLDKGSRTASTLSTATLASLGGASSRRGSCDTSFSVETEASIREIKDSLVEAEEKYRRAMVSNVQLHSEKMALMYQVDTLREELNDMEEMLWEARRQCDVTAKEFERERQNHTVTQLTLKHMRDAEREKEELLTEVCELRGRSRTHRQEVSDLQEALQWKEKRIMALERHKDLCDVTGLKKEGVVSPDAAPNGELEKCTAQEACPGVRESMLGEAGAQRPAEDATGPQDERKDTTCPQDERKDATCPQDERKDATCRTFKCSVNLRTLQPENFTSTTQPGSAVAMVTAEDWVLPGRSKHNTRSESRPVPPQPQRELLLDYEEPDHPLPWKLKPDTASGSVEDLTQTCLSVDQQNPEEHGRTSRDDTDDEDGLGQSEDEDREGQNPQVLSRDLKSAGPQSPGEDKHVTFSGFSCSDGGDEPKNQEPDPRGPEEGEEVKNQRIYEEESPLVQKTNLELIFENQNQTPQSSAGSLFVHRGALKDWTGLDKMVQSILRQFLQNQSFVAEMRNRVPKLTGSVNWWIPEGQDMEMRTQAKVLDKQGLQDHTKPLADGDQTQDPSGTGSIIDREAAGRRSEVTFRTPASEDQRNQDPDLTPGFCCHRLVFVESYFAEPFESRAEDCGSDQDSVDLDHEPEEPAGSPAEGLQEEQHQTNCCLHHKSKVVFPVKNRKQKNDCDIL